MAKILSRPKKKIAAKKAEAAEERRIVLVGTYAARQLEKWSDYYNYPLYGKDKIDVETVKKVNELWLFSGAKQPRYFAAECLGVKTREELKEFGYKATGKGHGSGKYLLFKIKKLYAPSRDFAESVTIRTKDFAGQGVTQKQLKAYLESPDRKDPLLAKMLPKIVTELPRERLRVCEAAVQLDFFNVFSYDSVMRPDGVKKSRRRKRTAMSLFSGAGGLDIGVLQAGFEVLSCVELDPNACETLRHAVAVRHDATKVFEGDIKAFTPEQMLQAVGKKPGEVDLLFGGPPCQAFSLIGKQKALDDERGMLLFQMIRYTKVIQPRVVMMEQVKGLLSARDAKGLRGGVLQKLLKDFSDLGYVAKYKVCLAADYGAAQLRERVILVATKDRNGFEFPPPLYQNPHAANLFSSLPPWRTVGGVGRTGAADPETSRNNILSLGVQKPC